MLGPNSSTTWDALAKLQLSTVMKDWSISPFPSSIWLVPPTSEIDCRRHRHTPALTKIGDCALSCRIMLLPPSPMSALLVVLMGPLIM